MRIAISGASGLVGSELVSRLGPDNEITRLVRRRERAKRGTAYWNVRLLDHLVDRGRVRGRETIAGPDGTLLRLESSANGQFVRVCRD